MFDRLELSSLQESESKRHKVREAFVTNNAIIFPPILDFKCLPKHLNSSTRFTIHDRSQMTNTAQFPSLFSVSSRGMGVYSNSNHVEGVTDSFDVESDTSVIDDDAFIPPHVQKMLIDKLKPVLGNLISEAHKELSDSLLDFKVAKIMECIQTTDAESQQSISAAGKPKLKGSNTIPYFNTFDKAVLLETTESSSVRTIFKELMNNWLDLRDDLVSNLSKKRYNFLRGNSGKFSPLKHANGNIFIEETKKVILSEEEQLKLCCLVLKEMEEEDLPMKESYKIVTKYYKVTEKYIVFGNFALNLVEHKQAKTQITSQNP